MLESFYNIIKKIFVKDRMKEFYKKYFYVKQHKGILKNIYEIQLLRLYRKYNCWVPTIADIKESVVFPHELNGIFISQGAKIGENCVIFHQVTIGSNNLKDSKRKGAPQIGNDVYIGAGAKIIGKVKIGNNVRIGANCVVTKDVPDNCTVVLSENRIIKHEGERDNKFYGYDPNDNQ